MNVCGSPVEFEFILPGYEVMEELAARYGIGLVLKGTPYGRRIPRGAEAVAPEALEAAFARIGDGVDGAGSAGEAIDSLGLDAGLTALIRTRVEISNGHPIDDLELSVLEEGASTFGDFDNHTLEGGNMALADALAADLGDSVRLSSPVLRIRWRGEGQGGPVTLATEAGELEADAAVIAIPTAPLAEV